MLRLTRTPFAMLKPDGKAERLALVERVTRAPVNDSDVTLLSGIVVLTGGCLDSEQAVCDQETGHDAYAVDVLRTAQSMMLFVHQMLKVSRCYTREKLLETRRALTRRALTQYEATPVVVIGPGTKRRLGAFLSLTELVQHQVALAKKAGVLTVPSGWRRIPVIICVDTCPLWRTPATRADVFVGVWPGGPRAAGVPPNWATWWVMAGADDRAWLCGMDAAAGWNSQVEYLEANNNVVLENGQTIGFECFLTGDGKGMQVSNYSPVTKCWTCDDGDSLEPHDNVPPMARQGAFLRALQRTKRVGDYAHCAARLCNAIAKRLASDLSAWVASGDGRGVIGRMQEVWSDIMQEAANVPFADRVALRPQKKDMFDLTPARIFLEKLEYQKRVVELLKEFYPNRTVDGKNVKVYTVVFSIIRSVADLHGLWRKKTFLSDAEVAGADQAAK